MNFHPTRNEVPGVNPIETLAGEVQTFPPETRWLHANQNVIQAIACGTPVVEGPRTRTAAMLLAVFAFPRLARLAACAGSFCLLVAFHLKQLRTRSSSTLSRSLFVGVGALRETQLRRALAEERGEAVSFLNETTVDSFASVFTLGFAELVREWRAVTADVWTQLIDHDREGIPSRYRRMEFLTHAHRYAWFRAWFSGLRTRFAVNEPIVFSAASYVSAAAIAAGWRAAYYLHGFQAQSLVFPNFDEVRCFTAPELAHFARRLPKTRLRQDREPGTPIATERLVTVAGCYGQTVGYDDCASFIEWARRAGIPVVLRPHPLDTSGFYERWRNCDGVSFSNIAVPFEQFLETSRPRFVLSWYSTALYDALRRGIVPVTVRTKSWRSLDMVFPFNEISLRWPKDETLAQTFMLDDAARLAFLTEKRALAGVASELSS